MYGYADSKAKLANNLKLRCIHATFPSFVFSRELQLSGFQRDTGYKVQKITKCNCTRDLICTKSRISSNFITKQLKLRGEEFPEDPRIVTFGAIDHRCPYRAFNKHSCWSPQPPRSLQKQFNDRPTAIACIAITNGILHHRSLRATS